MAGVSNPTVEHDAKTRGIILHIVEQIKSQGVFDRFRRDCLEELDGKEPYRQLKQRVESHVATFLSKQTFSANLPKNQLRTSLRANINQSEVLSKGVDRLLEQVLVEKSTSFYKEIENLVEEHLISTGHYTRYDKSQKSDGQPRSELTKLSDKEVEDIIKQETDRLLEESKESDKSSMADTPPPGTSGEVIEVETLISTVSDENSVTTSQHLEAGNFSGAESLKSGVSTEKTSADKPEYEESFVKETTEENLQNDELKPSNTLSSKEITQTHANKGQEMVAKPYISLGANSDVTSQMSVPEIVAESNQGRSSVSVDDNPRQAMDIEPEPLSPDQNINELPGKICENKTQKLEASAEAAVKIGQSAEQHEISEGDTTVVLDLQAVASRSKLGKGRENVIPATEVKSAEISEAMVDNQKLSQPERDVAKSGNGKFEIEKPEKAEVSKLKVVKIGNTELYKAEVVKPEVIQPEGSKSKVKLQEDSKAQKKQSRLSSKTVTKATAKKPISMPNIFSTDEETDEDLVISAAKILANQHDDRKPEFSAVDIAELSDSDITVSSVHTSDLSSLEDSDMEYEDYQELVLKKSQGKQSNTTTSGKNNESIPKEPDADIKMDEEKNKGEAKPSECSSEAEGKVDMVIKKFDIKEEESDGFSRVAKEEAKETKSVAAMDTRIDGESGGSEERKVDDEVVCKNKNSEESDASSSKEKDEENVDDTSTTASSFAHDSAAVSQQTTEPNRSEGAQSTSIGQTEKEQTSPKDEKPTCSQVAILQVSEAALFRPIVPEEPHDEPASSQDSEAGHVQACSPSDNDHETTGEDSDVGNMKLGKRRRSNRISTEQESESSNDAPIPTEEHREASSQRRSARVASKEKTKPDQKDDHGQGNNVRTAEDAGDQSAKQLRRTRYSQDRTDELKAPKSKEEKRTEKRASSDSTDSDVRPSKRSKRTVRPTRCYSPSENS